MEHDTNSNVPSKKDDDDDDDDDDDTKTVPEIDISQVTEGVEHMKLLVKLEKRNLYGGAMSLTLPYHWRDVSMVRQVPDHQEVYQDVSSTSNSSSSSSSGCIIIEILERQDDVSNESAASFFFTDLMEQQQQQQQNQDRKSPPITTTTKKQLPTVEWSRIWTAGMEPNSDANTKNNNNKEEDTKTTMMPHLNTCVKACTGMGYPSSSSSKEKVYIELCVLRLESIQTDLLITLYTPQTTTTTTTKQQQHSQLFLSILNSFQIHDWTLFV